MRQIDKELRLAIISLIERLAYYHPPVRGREHLNRIGVPECWACRDVSKMLDLLDAEQREYGPPIDMTDPSYVRAKASQP